MAAFFEALKSGAVWRRQDCGGVDRVAVRAGGKKLSRGWPRSVPAWRPMDALAKIHLRQRPGPAPPAAAPVYGERVAAGWCRGAFQAFGAANSIRTWIPYRMFSSRSGRDGHAQGIIICVGGMSCFRPGSRGLRGQQRVRPGPGFRRGRAGPGCPRPVVWKDV